MTCYRCGDEIEPDEDWPCSVCGMVLCCDCIEDHEYQCAEGDEEDCDGTDKH